MSSENKIKRTMIDYISWLHNVSKSFKKTLNSKHKTKLERKSQRYRNTKDENLVLPKEQIENADLINPYWTKYWPHENNP